MFIKVVVAFAFGLLTLKDLEPKNKGHMNSYERCDLIQHQTPPSNSLIYKIQKSVDHNSKF